MKIIDKVYFACRDRWQGLKHGYSASRAEGYSLGYLEAYEGAEIDKLKGILELLDSKNPKLNNAEFQLGYLHAIAVIKGEI